MIQHSIRFRLALACGLTLSAACAATSVSNDAVEANVIASDASDGGAADSAAHQTPPFGDAAALDAWLAEGHYRAWACEADAHASRPPSGHSPNRICSNAQASSHGDGEYPVGATSVKELYDSSSTRIVGYAVATKVAAGGGESWYWYERLDGRVIANGLGTSGTPRNVCARCHERAGASTFGHDLVFTQIH